MMDPSNEVNVIELHTVTSLEDGEERIGDSQEVPEQNHHDKVHHDRGNYIIQGEVLSLFSLYFYSKF